MDIVRLIKISSQFPNTRLAKATRNYLLSLVEKEVDHNSRIARLTDRVASSPSNHWQKGLMLLKMASQGNDVDRLLEHWEDRSSQSLAFEGDKGELIRLAYENPSLRPLVLKKAIDKSSAFENALNKIAEDDELLAELCEDNEFLAEFVKLLANTDEPIDTDEPMPKTAATSKAELKQERRTTERVRGQKAQKSKGKKEQTQLERKEKGKSRKALLEKYKKMLKDDSGSVSQGLKLKIIRKVYAQIGKKSKALGAQADGFKAEWGAFKEAPYKISYTNDKGTKVEKEIKFKNFSKYKTIKDKGQAQAYESEWKKAYESHINKIFSLYRKALAGGGGAAKKEEPSKSEDTSTSKSEGDKGEDKGIVESLMESEGISKEEAQEYAGNILGDEGEEEEETTDAPDSSESATGQSVSTSGGLGGLGGGESGGSKPKGQYTPVPKKKKDKKKSKRKMQTQSRRKNRGKKGSELELNTSTDLDIMF